MPVPLGNYLIIDGVLVVNDFSGGTITITSNGATINDTTWTYSGAGTFLGLSTTQGATTPDGDLEVGDTKELASKSYEFYSVVETITDLTGYTWVANETPYGSDLGKFYLSFVCDNRTYYSFEIAEGRGGYATILYDSVTTCEDGEWANVSYKTIQITGGTDATNSDLIAWLEANGTLTEPEPTPTGINNVSIGTLKLAKAFVSNNEIASMWLGNVKIYEKGGTPSGYNITISGVYQADASSNTSSAIEIDGVICEVDIYGTATNIPHTFTNIVVQPNGEGAIYFNVHGTSDRYINGQFKIISGTGTINSMQTWAPIENITPNMELTVGFSDDRYIVPTSDLVIQLGYYED